MGVDTYSQREIYGSEVAEVIWEGWQLQEGQISKENPVWQKPNYFLQREQTGTFSGSFSDDFCMTIGSWVGMSVKMGEVVSVVSKSEQPKAPSRILSRDEVFVPVSAHLMWPDLLNGAVLFFS